MSKKKSRPRTNRKRAKRGRDSYAPPQSESRAVEAATVAWMLTCLIGLIANLLVIVGLSIEGLSEGAWQEGENDRSILILVTIIVLFVALFVSPINLILAATLKRVRHNPPPKAVLIGAIVIAVIPIPLLLIARTMV